MSSKEQCSMKGLYAYGINRDNIKMLEEFTNLIKINYGILEITDLKFFKDWLVCDLKAQIPKYSSQPEGDNEENAHREYFALANVNQSSNSALNATFNSENFGTTYQKTDQESDLLNDFQEMGDRTKAVTEAEKEEAQVMKNIGVEALNNGDYEVAVKHLSSGILLDSCSSDMFLKRGIAYFNMMEPTLAIRDMKKAIALDPDCAPAHIVLGKASMQLGQVVEACCSFEDAQSIEYDSEVDDIIGNIKSKAVKVLEKRNETKELPHKATYQSQKIPSRKKEELYATGKEKQVNEKDPSLVSLHPRSDPNIVQDRSRTEIVDDLD